MPLAATGARAGRRCFASPLTDRAIHFRLDNGFDQFRVTLSAAVQKVVDGAGEPDELLVFRPTFQAARRTVLRHTLASQNINT